MSLSCRLFSFERFVPLLCLASSLFSSSSLPSKLTHPSLLLSLFSNLTGHQIRPDLQISHSLRSNQPPLSPHHQKDLDVPSTLGGLHPSRQDAQHVELSSTASASEGSVEGDRREGGWKGSQGRVEGVCVEEGERLDSLLLSLGFPPRRC